MDHLSTNSSTIIIIIIISLLFNRALTTNRLKGYLMIKSLLYDRSVPSSFVDRIIKRRRSGTTYSLRMHSPWIGVIIKSRNHRVSIRRNSFLNVKKVRALLKESIVLSQRREKDAPLNEKQKQDGYKFIYIFTFGFLCFAKHIKAFELFEV